ncbi:PREDICTED: uncharacterized protein LOC106805598 [Priapulus caudatus]|uniref:Uncharacterized protein LOC106805598 n=1 Tax=Priapulus caudatus TaxID=37621 RepID=A0ABM1DS24_PRICU|nr:PREDICTED: uncharacterized protein LOC106805598 [Priapulus caudatus]
MDVINKIFPLHSAWATAIEQIPLKTGVDGTGMIYGEEKSGKTSLLFQYAVTCASHGQNILFICKEKLATMPFPVHGMPAPQHELLKLVKIMYMSSAVDLIQHLASIHKSPVSPAVLVIDDLDFFARQFKTDTDSQSFSRLCAALVDSGKFMAHRNKTRCQVLVSASDLNKQQVDTARQFFKSLWMTEDVNYKKYLYRLHLDLGFDQSTPLEERGNTMRWLFFKYYIQNEKLFLDCMVSEQLPGAATSRSKAKTKASSSATQKQQEVNPVAAMAGSTNVYTPNSQTVSVTYAPQNEGDAIVYIPQREAAPMAYTQQQDQGTTIAYVTSRDGVAVTYAPTMREGTSVVFVQKTDMMGDQATYIPMAMPR